MELMEGITVTNEKTLLQEQIEELKARLSVVTRDRDAAMQRIGDMQREMKNESRLVMVMADSSAKAKREMQELKARHRREMADLMNASQRRETMTGVVCLVGGFLLAAALVVACYLLTR